ncbi:hypothetical protein [Labrenzia sp. VG12]|uniref:hypothetical protein n=1 Tax=Labrenzia sp. VG12 TaxID=2021862 RepID=UPI0012FE247A|nr:hypothetical protein [Labrenzia sp. VG12]
MTSDPTLFTSFEWVLLAMAALVSLTMFALFYRSDPDFPFAEQEENWARDRATPGKKASVAPVSTKRMNPGKGR